MGFPLDAFCGVITSGEVTHAALTARASPFWAARHRCVHFTWADRGAISLEGLGVEVVQDPDDADFVLAHGTEALGVGVDGVGAHRQPLPMLKAVLQACAARNLPLVVANPDVVTVHGTELRTMPGTLARWYAEFGGEVHTMGKPAGVMYDGALALLGGVERHRVLAVGDSLEHDIAGACGAGIDSVLVAGGIHAAQLLPEGTIEVNGARLAQLCDEYGAAPRYVMPFIEC
jgi:HAD superfamily hydrolase (TIGR01459 family)